jgi:integrase
MAGQKGRRGNGEGSIAERELRNAAGEVVGTRWEARLTLPNGKRRSFYGKTREEARKRLAAAIRDRDLGLPVVAEKQTVAAFLASWLEIVKPTIGAETYRRYEQQVRIHLAPALGRHRLARLSAQHVQTFYAAKLTEGKAPGTVHHMHMLLTSALAMAVKLGSVQRNVAELVTPPQPAQKEMHPLDAAQVRLFLDTVRSGRLEALYVLLVTTGVRIGEALALRWQDFDADAALLHIRHTLHHVKGGTWRLTAPKTKTSRRKIELPASTVDALRAHRARQLAERLQVGELWEDHGFIFADEIGRPLRASHLHERSFLLPLKRAGLPRIRIHDLRHTAATLLLTNGVFVKQVSEMLGHANVAITMTVYAHVLPTMHKEAAAVMDRLVSSR